jgi:hypothetical protein
MYWCWLATVKRPKQASSSQAGSAKADSQFHDCAQLSSKFRKPDLAVALISAFCTHDVRASRRCLTVSSLSLRIIGTEPLQGQINCRRGKGAFAMPKR